MDNRGQDFYKLVEQGMFGQDMITYIDTTFKDLYGKPTAKDFRYDPPQQDFSYEFFEAKYGISSMATYMDMDSHATPEGFDEASVRSGKIFTFKTMSVFSRRDMLRYMQTQSSFGNLSTSQRTALQDIVYGTFNDLLQQNQNLVAYNRDQAVSTGVFAITQANNPNSPFVGTTIDYSVPAANYIKAGFKQTTPAKWWDYNATTGDITSYNEDADPLKDLIDMYRYAKTTKRKMVGAFEMSETVFYNFWNHPSVKKQVLNLNFVQSSKGDSDMTYMMNTVTPEMVEGWLKGRGLPPIVVTDNQYAVKSFNDKTRKMDESILEGFSSQYIVLRPALDYGVIKTAEPIAGEIGNPNEVIFNGRTLVTKDYNSKEKTHWTETEESSLAILTKPTSMFYLEMGVAHS